jgi:hypothetical protein
MQGMIQLCYYCIGAQWLFCGLGDNLTYISGTLDYFDNCNTDTFSLLWIEDFLMQFNYHFDGKLHVYWLKPWNELINGSILARDHLM